MDFDAPPADPIKPFEAWLHEAEGTGLPNPGAMQLATADPDGRPSIRVVLLKGFDERGVVVYTNRESRKGRALAANPIAALGIHWDPLMRQVIIEGAVTLLDDAGSDAYFASRPRASQIGAWASRQSEPAASRAELDQAFTTIQTRFDGGDVPRPPHWGGYRVQLDSIEFWQGREARLHPSLPVECRRGRSHHNQPIAPAIRGHIRDDTSRIDGAIRTKPRSISVAPQFLNTLLAEPVTRRPRRSAPRARRSCSRPRVPR